MPVIHRSSYRAPFLFNNGHLQTLYPTIARAVTGVAYQRERIVTPDDDFLDLDWLRTGNRQLAVLSHGLEGHTGRPYMTGMARMLSRHGWDVLAWNYRACSGEINRRLRMYHNGCIDDLDCVVQHGLKDGRYGRTAMIGFSLGGNLTLMYLGSKGTALDPRVRGAVAFSVPCDLKAGALELAKARNYLYMKQFLVSLHKKIKLKMEQMPGLINDDGYGSIRDFRGFDDRYTAPMNGFKDAEDYWYQCSSSRFLHSITVPTLLVNALDDPFLAPGCYPVDQAEQSRHVHLEMPRSGGHVGFVQFNADGSYWSENRAIEFLGQAW
ncbi:MAG: YheT family hydrolase [Nitrospirota bacterium]